LITIGKFNKSRKTGARISFTLWDDDDERLVDIEKEPVKKARKKIQEAFDFKL
tara:strand:- start:8944 stop:9102 length:159 start_codon:yes stop_codon:yes gene_type:complete